MAATATINSRISEPLKRHGGQVLERNNMSTTEAIRKLYEFLEREQRLPDWMREESNEKYDARRAAANKLAVKGLVPNDVDAHEAYRAHLLEKRTQKERS